MTPKNPNETTGADDYSPPYFALGDLMATQPEIDNYYRNEFDFTVSPKSKDDVGYTSPSFEAVKQSQGESKGVEPEPPKLDAESYSKNPEELYKRDVEEEEHKEEGGGSGILGSLIKHRSDLIAAMAAGAALFALWQTDTAYKMQEDANKRDDALAVLAKEAAAREVREAEMHEAEMMRNMVAETLQLRRILYEEEDCIIDPCQIEATKAERQKALLRLVEVEREIKNDKNKKNTVVKIKKSPDEVVRFFSGQGPSKILFEDPKVNASGEFISEVTLQTNEGDFEYLMSGRDIEKGIPIALSNKPKVKNNTSKKTQGEESASLVFLRVKRKVDLKELDLSNINLSHADLSEVNLQNANLSHSIFDYANLSSTNLSGANLENASLNNADLSGVWLEGANLKGVLLWNTNLTESWFSGADFNGATLQGAILNGADLVRAKNLTQEQLNQACGNEKTRLPEGLTIPYCQNK